MGGRGVSEVLYLYGFVPAEREAPPAELVGMEDGAVEIEPLAGFSAAFTHVPADPYGAEALESLLSDLRWVADRGLTHERVVAWFVDRGPIVPAPLFTLYSTAESMRRAVEDHAVTIREQLRRFEGVREWDLKVAWDAVALERHAAAVSDDVRALDEDIAAAAPGRRYLLERKRASLLADELSRAARRIAGELLEEVRAFAGDAVTLPATGAAGELPVVLRAALLVPTEEEEAFARHLSARREELGAIGVSVHFSGPWAPYRFVEGAHGGG
jgi:hypothetical protein